MIGTEGAQCRTCCGPGLLQIDPTCPQEPTPTASPFSEPLDPSKPTTPCHHTNQQSPPSTYPQAMATFVEGYCTFCYTLEERSGRARLFGNTPLRGVGSPGARAGTRARGATPLTMLLAPTLALLCYTALFQSPSLSLALCARPCGYTPSEGLPRRPKSRYQDLVTKELAPVLLYAAMQCTRSEYQGIVDVLRSLQDPMDVSLLKKISDGPPLPPQSLAW